MYSLVFGESVLNDAVAIVLYKTLVSFKGKTVSVKSCGLAVGQFLTIFVGSFTVGIVVALVSSLLFKKASFARAKNTDTTLQVAIAVLFPYCAYMIAEGLTLSGIVAILFTGVTMAHYTLKNLGAEARRAHSSRASSGSWPRWRRPSSSSTSARRCSWLTRLGGTSR